MSGRVYERKFDWDEARLLRAQGHTYASIAAMLGVSRTAVELACNPRRRAAAAARVSEYQRSGKCVDCGTRISRNASHPASRCRECFRHLRATSVRDNVLYCSECHEWKRDNEFPYSRTKSCEIRRGRHKTCRVCLTRLRQDYRERHKAQCVGCGKPALMPNEKRTRGTSYPRCRECFNVWQRLPEQREAARQRALRRNGTA